MACLALHVFEETCKKTGITIGTRYSTRVWRKNHLRSFSVRPQSFSMVSTAFKWVICSSIVFEKTIMYFVEIYMLDRKFHSD